MINSPFGTDPRLVEAAAIEARPGVPFINRRTGDIVVIKPNPRVGGQCIAKWSNDQEDMVTTKRSRLQGWVNGYEFCGETPGDGGFMDKHVKICELRSKGEIIPELREEDYHPDHWALIQSVDPKTGRSRAEAAKLFGAERMAEDQAARRAEVEKHEARKADVRDAQNKGRKAGRSK